MLVYGNGLAEPMSDLPKVEMKIIDGAAFVNMNPTTISNRYWKYCDMELKAKVLQITNSLQQADIFFHNYQQNTVKKDTRDIKYSSLSFKILWDTMVIK